MILSKPGVGETLRRVLPLTVGLVLMVSPARAEENADWVAGRAEQDFARVAEALLRLPESTVLSLSHDTDALEKLIQQLKNQPGGQKTFLTLPFAAPKTGTWFVVQGQLDLVSHRKGTSNAWAWDLVLKNAAGQQTDPVKSGNEAHFCWNQPVLAPAPGAVLKVENSKPDHAPSAVPKDGGNFVILDHLNGEATALWHFKQGSVVVKPGDRVRRGDMLGACGNSGNSLFPHIHMQLDKLDPVTGQRTAAPAVLGIYRRGKTGETLERHRVAKRGEFLAPFSLTPALPVGVSGD